MGVAKREREWVEAVGAAMASRHVRVSLTVPRKRKKEVGWAWDGHRRWAGFGPRGSDLEVGLGQKK